MTACGSGSIMVWGSQEVGPPDNKNNNKHSKYPGYRRYRDVAESTTGTGTIINTLGVPGTVGNWYGVL